MESLLLDSQALSDYYSQMVALEQHFDATRNAIDVQSNPQAQVRSEVQEFANYLAPQQIAAMKLQAQSQGQSQQAVVERPSFPSGAGQTPQQPQGFLAVPPDQRWKVIDQLEAKRIIGRNRF